MTKLHSIEPLEARIAPAVAVFEISNLNGSNGFTLVGAAADDEAGFSASDAGDVNGDGFADVIIGAPGADPNGGSSGASYVVFGKVSGFAARLNLSTLDGSNGFKLSGTTMEHTAGFSVSGAGDVNGDGFDDVLVGAPRADPNAPDAGASYLVFGKASGFAANLNLSTLDGSNGFRISGEAQDDHSGSSVSAAGDVNGDGFDDLIIGAASGDQSGGLDSGAIYVVFGKGSGFAANLNLSTLDGSNGFKLSGVATFNTAGLSVSAAGDINSDGFGDVIIGASFADPNGNFSGASYVVFGQASGFAANLDLAALDGTNGFKLSGVAAGDAFGRSVSAAGDVNGDGFDDVIVGAPRATSSGPGASYVVFGKASGFAANFDPATLDGTNGFKLSGVATERGSGNSVSAAGDFNGDNLGDLIIGAGSQTTYVVFGKGSGFGANLNLSTVDGSNGFKLTRAGSTDLYGTSVSTAGDVNGDGFDDLLIGARDDGPNVSHSGQSYVIFGSALGPFATMRISDATVTEPLSGTTTASFTVTLSTPNAQTVTVQYSTADGSATAPDDYTAASGLTLTFAPGETSKTLLIPINANAPVELDETFFVNLSNPTNATLDDAQGVGTINDESATFQLSSLNGLNGFKLSGVAAGDFSGRSVSDAGDVNGDGFGDLIIGAYTAGPNGFISGASYVVFGKAGGLPANLNLSTLNGSNGFKLSGVAAGDRSGTAVSAAGDVNGDGYGDLIIGALNADPSSPESGASYVIFGKVGGFAADVNLSTLDGSNGFKLSGVATYDNSGHSVSGAGDVNGDGFGDLIIGAPHVDANGYDSGASYVVFGKASAFAANLNLSTLDGSNGFKLSGVAAEDYSGYSVSTAGDVNGDGFDDLIIGAFGAVPNGIYSGASYVVFGKANGFGANLQLSALDGSNGFTLSGVVAGDYLGHSVSSAGDVNGDGFDDLIVGASNADRESGASYVVFGKASGFAANLNLSTLDGSNGFQLSGDAEGESSGRSVSGAGDVNGDGFDDVIIGAYRADANGFAGASYLVFGQASGFAANLDLAALDGTNGFKLAGVATGDLAGFSVSGAGDFNGDGVGDLLIGAFGADPNGADSGASYVVFGQGPPPPSVSIGDVTAVEGDAGTSAILFPVTLSSASTQTVTVQFSTVNGTAIAGSDYTAQSDQTLEFAPGETTKMITVNVLGDTTVETGETFLVNLSNPTNATLADAQGQGTILNDDAVQLVISPNGHRATFPDVDGDLVTVTTTRGAFVPGNFVFGPVGQLIAIDLTASSNPGAFTGAKITAFAQTAGGGDGLVNVGAFKASWVNLQKVTIDGDLGEIDVGTGGPGNVALQKLIANSMGLGASVAPGTESTFAGTVGALKIAHDVKAVLNIKGGPGSAGIDVVAQVVIGGSLDGSAGGLAAGLVRASGGIGKVVVKESVIGGAEQSGIVAGGNLGGVKIGGDLRSADPARPVTISALGDLAATDAEQALALTRLTVGGSVLNAEILAGYRRDGTPSNPDAGIGSIVVMGNWSASSVAAGVVDTTGDGFGRNDALIAGDTTPLLFARIASITIAGTATGSSAADDHFGITAQQIGRLIAGTNTPAFTAGPDNILLDPVHRDFRVVDFA